VSRSSPASNDFACCARLTALSASVGGSTAAVSTAGPTLFGWLERVGGAGDGSRSPRSRTKRSSSRLRCARAPDPAHCYALPAPLGGLFARGQHVAGYGRQAAVPPLRPFPGPPVLPGVFHSHNSVDRGAIEACPASLAALQSYRRQGSLACTAAVLAEVKGVQALPLGRAQ
jgi:hypothetical protein